MMVYDLWVNYIFIILFLFVCDVYYDISTYVSLYIVNRLYTGK